MPNLIDRVADMLFPQGEQRTLNIKFFCGGEENVSAHDIAEQVFRAETQRQNGTAKLVTNIDSELTAA